MAKFGGRSCLQIVDSDDSKEIGFWDRGLSSDLRCALFGKAYDSPKRVWNRTSETDKDLAARLLLYLANQRACKTESLTTKGFLQT